MQKTKPIQRFAHKVQDKDAATSLKSGVTRVDEVSLSEDLEFGRIASDCFDFPTERSQSQAECVSINRQAFCRID